MLTSQVKPTKPFGDQKPEAGGFRRPVSVFQQEDYAENLLQCVVGCLLGPLREATLVVGGDGRFLCRRVARAAIAVCAANGVRKLVVGHQGVLSGPALSLAVRSRGASAGVLLTAGPLPGGPFGHFGVHVDGADGAPMPDAFMGRVEGLAESISEYRTCLDLDCDLHLLQELEFTVDSRPFAVEVIDPVQDYLAHMKTIFDFEAIRALVEGSSHGRLPLKFTISSMLGVTGSYVCRIFLEELKANPGCVVDAFPSEDFGGRHPDPNMTYAMDLVKIMKEKESDFGAAFGADGGRCMILGHKANFVSPSDTLAIIAANASHIPYFKNKAVKGVGRSMPTSRAVDRVCQKNGLDLYEVPSGWKYFGNLMDAGLVSICGEECFEISSDHIREKDGIWVALAWMSILASRKMTVEEVLRDHWKTYGRNFFTRHDYISRDTESCHKMFQELEKMCVSGSMVNKQFSYQQSNSTITYTVAKMDIFSYKDPTDGTVVNNQGISILMTDDSRIVFRLGETRASNITVHVYVESYEPDPSKCERDTQDVLKPLMDVALQISKLQEHIGCKEPTLIN